MLLQIVLIIIGFIFLIKGSDFLVRAAVSIAKRFGLSEMIIGLTILAVGTSLPEIFITITSALDGHFDLIIGNSIGSSICNFLFVIGLTSIIRPVKFDKRIINRHLPIGMFAMVLLLLLGNNQAQGQAYTITRLEGIYLLFWTVLYIIYSIYEEKKLHNEKADEELIKSVEEREDHTISMIIAFIIVGILGLKFGADFVVDGATYIASALGLSEKFIGMTVVAVGTALPEIITGIISARQDETDLILGNITGSNIINLCLLIGIGATITPMTYSTDFNISIIFLIIVTLVLQMIAIINKKSELSRKRGLILVIIYFCYIAYML